MTPVAYYTRDLVAFVLAGLVAGQQNSTIWAAFQVQFPGLSITDFYSALAMAEMAEQVAVNIGSLDVSDPLWVALQGGQGLAPTVQLRAVISMTCPGGTTRWATVDISVSWNETYGDVLAQLITEGAALAEGSGCTVDSVNIVPSTLFPMNNP